MRLIALMRFIATYAATYAMRGRYQALIAISAFAVLSLFLPPISLISSSLFALVVLRKGWNEGLWVMAFGVLALGLGATLFPTGNALQGLGYGLLLWLPVLPVAVVLRETRSLALALDAALALGLTVVAFVYALVSDPAALWRERMRIFVQALEENAPDGFDPAMFAKAMDVFSHYMTGAIVGGSVLSLVLGLLIARWLQALLYNPGGFRREFVELKLRPLTVYAGLVCVLVGLLVGGGVVAELAWNLMGIFLVIFTIAGFSIVHAVLGGKGVWILIIYLALQLIPKWLITPIVLIGISDLWADWRKYANKT